MSHIVAIREPSVPVPIAVPFLGVVGVFPSDHDEVYSKCGAKWGKLGNSGG